MSAARHPRPAGGRPAALAVLVGHGLLLLAVGRALAPQPPPPAPARAPVLAWLRMLAPAPPDGPRTIAEAPPRHLPARPGRPAAAADRPAPAATVPATIGATPPPTPPWSAPAAAAAPPPDTASQLPLDLRWRPPATAGAARAADLVRQARDAAAPPDAGSRLAQALGTDTRLHEEDRGEVRRFRRAGSCVDTRATRESQINPFDATASRMPRLVEPC